MADRIELDALITQVAAAWIKAAEAVELAHPQWHMASAELRIRAALTVQADGSIIADLDEPERLMHEFPIPLIRRG